MDILRPEIIGCMFVVLICNHYNIFSAIRLTPLVQFLMLLLKLVIPMLIVEFCTLLSILTSNGIGHFLIGCLSLCPQFIDCIIYRCNHADELWLSLCNEQRWGFHLIWLIVNIGIISLRSSNFCILLSSWLLLPRMNSIPKSFLFDGKCCGIGIGRNISTTITASPIDGSRRSAFLSSRLFADGSVKSSSTSIPSNCIPSTTDDRRLPMMTARWWRRPSPILPLPGAGR